MIIIIHIVSFSTIIIIHISMHIIEMSYGF